MLKRQLSECRALEAKMLPKDAEEHRLYRDAMYYVRKNKSDFDYLVAMKQMCQNSSERDTCEGVVAISVEQAIILHYGSLAKYPHISKLFNAMVEYYAAFASRR